MIRYCLLLLLATCRYAGGQEADTQIFHLQDFAGRWKLVTNADQTVTATEKAIHRDGNQVFARVFTLKPVLVKPGVTKGSEAQIRSFISQYHPPPIRYTSPGAALRSGGEKFNCLEFAQDIVTQASSNHISSEVVGILFTGKQVGHACAGFPTIDGSILFYDSTPSSGKISQKAHEATVETGSPYRRSDGGELGGGVGWLPISQIVAVTPLVESAPDFVDLPPPIVLSPRSTLIVQGEDRARVRGILYAGPDGYDVSDAQIEKWKEAAVEQAAETARQKEARKKARDDTAAKLAAKILADNEQLAAEGDAYAQLRMGQRYLKGDGVPKDISQARFFLQKAADQGSPTAVDELLRLDH